MFAARLFPSRFFPRRYFPAIGAGVSLVPGSLPTVDTFTDTNGTDLEDHVPDDGDGRWRVILGTATTQGGGARVPGVDEQLAVIDVGSADYTFSLEFSSDLGTESHTFVIFRYADADNFWAVRNALGDFELFEVTGGEENVRASGSTGGNHPCRIVVTCDGDEITAATEEIDGTARGDPISYSSATHNDATAVGFWVKAGGTTVFFDNLNVTGTVYVSGDWPTVRAFRQDRTIVAERMAYEGGRVMRFRRKDKSPSEDMPWDWDFSVEDVFDDDPIGSATVTDWEGDAVSGITVGTPAISSPVVQTRIAGGTAGDIYYLKCKATSATNGYDREIFMKLWVRLPDADE